MGMCVSFHRPSLGPDIQEVLPVAGKLVLITGCFLSKAIALEMGFIV